MSLNKVMLIGNVGKDPDVRYLDSNNQTGQSRKVATFPLATSERYKDRNGETKENTEWHNIVVWGQTADVVEKYVKKGTQLFIEGRIRTRSWTDPSGLKKYTTEINADSLQLLGRRENSDQAYQSGNYPSQNNYQSNQGTQAQSYSQPNYQQQYTAPQQPFTPPQPQNFAQPAQSTPQAATSQSFTPPPATQQPANANPGGFPTTANPHFGSSEETDDLPF